MNAGKILQHHCQTPTTYPNSSTNSVDPDAAIKSLGYQIRGLHDDILPNRELARLQYYEIILREALERDDTKEFWDIYGDMKYHFSKVLNHKWILGEWDDTNSE